MPMLPWCLFPSPYRITRRTFSYFTGSSEVLVEFVEELIVPLPDKSCELNRSLQHHLVS